MGKLLLAVSTFTTNTAEWTNINGYYLTISKSIEGHMQSECLRHLN